MSTTRDDELSLPIFSGAWLHLLSVNLIVFGVEVCASASFIYVPPIMLKMGYSETAMTITMGIGPLASLILVPGIGRMSDKLGGSGKRLPFIMVLSVLLLIGLTVIPYAGDFSPRFTFLALAVGVIFLDFTTQALLNPCKALVSDLLLEYRCPQQGFTMYSCMISSGSCFGYLVSSIEWQNTFVGKWFGSQEKMVFWMLSTAYTSILLLALFLIGRRRRPKVVLDSTESALPGNTPLILIEGKSAVDNEASRVTRAETSLPVASLFESVKCSLVTLCCSLCSFARLPSYLLRLFAANAFAWMAMHCHDSYYTDFVGKVVFGGDPEGQPESSHLYDEGVRMGSWGLLLQSIAATLYAAFIQDHLVKRHGQKRVFLLGLSSFTLCMIGMLLTTDITLVNFFTLVSGPGFAALTTIPCDIITGYHDQAASMGLSKERGIGEDMAIIDSASSLSQVVPSFFLGFLVYSFGSASVYVFFSALCGLAACFSAFFVTYTDDTPPNKIAHL